MDNDAHVSQPTDSAPATAPEPEAQQPEAQEQAAATAQATNGAARMAYDTPAAQELAAIKRELGLPKNARLDTVRARLSELSQPQETQSVDYDNLDPVVAARLQAADERVWGLTTEVHGDVFTGEARKLYEDVITNRDPHGFINALTQFIEAVTYDPNSEAPDAGADYEEESPQMPALGDADVPVAPRQMTKADPTMGGRRDSGDMAGFVGDRLRRLGILGEKEPRGA